jgi:uncharacterized protein (DUF58 family)
MPEDSARHVDWKATAKSGSLKVREFAREDERKLCIQFDNPEAGIISEAAYEKAVDLAASLAWHFSTQEAEVSYVIPGRPRTRDLHEFLAWLAVVKPVGAKEAGDPLHELSRDAFDEYNIVVTARTRGTVPTALWNSSYFVFVGEQESRAL